MINREMVPFKLYHMPCCGHLLCWVNPRPPSYCPECGQFTGAKQGLAEHIKFSDPKAWLETQETRP